MRGMGFHSLWWGDGKIFIFWGGFVPSGAGDAVIISVLTFCFLFYPAPILGSFVLMSRDAGAEFLPLVVMGGERYFVVLHNTPEEERRRLFPLGYRRRASFWMENVTQRTGKFRIFFFFFGGTVFSPGSEPGFALDGVDRNARNCFPFVPAVSLSCFTLDGGRELYLLRKHRRVFLFLKGLFFC